MVFGGLGIAALVTIGAGLGWASNDLATDETVNNYYETPPETTTDKVVKVAKAVAVPVGLYYGYKFISSKKKGG